MHIFGRFSAILQWETTSVFLFASLYSLEGIFSKKILEKTQNDMGGKNVFVTVRIPENVPISLKVKFQVFYKHYLAQL